MPRSTAVRSLAWGAVAVGIAGPALRRRLGLPRWLVSALAWQAPLAVAVAEPRSPARDAAVYAAQMIAYRTHYAMPDDDRDALLGRVRVSYPIRADRALGFGEVPTVRLQRAFGRPREVRLHDKVLSLVHWSWFAEPHLALVCVLLRRRHRFARSAALMAAVFDVGLVGYWAVPTAPPWWAGGRGEMAPVRRIMIEVGERFWGRLWAPLHDSFEGNQLAAMPSLHLATSVMAAHVLSEVGRGVALLGSAYAAVLGFALVYLGEHYVVDVVAGLALAEGVRRLAPPAAPVIGAVAGALRRLEQPGRCCRSL